MGDYLFPMDGVGKIAQCAWEGAFPMKCDHKAGFHNVPIAKESWKYFGVQWGGEYYAFTTLCFGWKISPFIDHSLSEAVAGYLRRKGLPVLTWIDDFYFTNFRSTKIAYISGANTGHTSSGILGDECVQYGGVLHINYKVRVRTHYKYCISWGRVRLSHSTLHHPQKRS